LEVKKLVDFILKKKETNLVLFANVEAKNIFGLEVDGVMNVKNVEVELHYEAVL
jgi:hypothetical protein